MGHLVPPLAEVVVVVDVAAVAAETVVVIGVAGVDAGVGAEVVTAAAAEAGTAVWAGTEVPVAETAAAAGAAGRC